MNQSAYAAYQFIQIDQPEAFERELVAFLVAR
jgi:hypothetical protein